MKVTDTYITGTGHWLPESVTSQWAVEAGLYSQEDRDADGFIGACIEKELAPPQMAVNAARDAIDNAGIAPTDISVVFHSSIWFQGVDMWPSASYVAAHAAHSGARAFDLQQQCNVGLGGMELASQLLTAMEGGNILMTTADRFGGDRIDRWKTENGVVYGDGAGAIVLSRNPGAFRILSTFTQAENDLEKVVRGPEFRENPEAGIIDITSRFTHFIGTGGMREAAGRLVSAVKNSVAGALEDADCEIGEMAHVVIPAVGRTKLDWQLQELIPVDLDRTNWSFASTTGHLGSGDQFVGLSALQAAGTLSDGDKVLLVGGGAGFTCTSVVLKYSATNFGTAPSTEEK
ncbi:ketoacyl-ACP synthase III family protein [Rhodococcus sp. H29-C3]|uniref:ketoacyl-ACP synthase III family protein n=1 Tax=Rhodococcus sp. H29-C3 TaxID=3046307 RepID=UPI0024BAE632|nr:ketoacyl-ACP synthase III family protein [Rhodococcus sp. H29-C3]MDJ0360819.1 ketoacyl-ACP synthase III family protein [Rhodococcus sp. H29-C3]